MQGLQRLRDAIRTVIASPPSRRGSTATARDVSNWTISKPRTSHALCSIDPAVTSFDILEVLLKQVYEKCTVTKDEFGQCQVEMCNGQMYVGSVESITNLLLVERPESKAWRRHEGLEK